MLKDVFGSAEHQDKFTYRLGRNMTLTRNNNVGVLNKAETIPDATIKNVKMHWYGPHYTPSVPHQGILPRRILNGTPSELR